jgi:hypothetical protein
MDCITFLLSDLLSPSLIQLKILVLKRKATTKSVNLFIAQKWKEKLHRIFSLLSAQATPIDDEGVRDRIDVFRKVMSRKLIKKAFVCLFSTPLSQLSDQLA